MTVLAIPPEMRRRLTTSDVQRMFEIGLIDPHERVELIEGELISRGKSFQAAEDGELAPMSPKHNKHEWLKIRLNRWLTRRLSDDLVLAVESTLYLDERTLVEPDMMIYPANILPEDVRGHDLKLAIEIGDTSLSFDLKTKAALYARYGISHYWAIDAETLETHRHSLPSDDGYQSIRTAARDEPLDLPFAPDLELQLGELK